MPADLYRYSFDQVVPGEEVETTLVLSILAVEALHGEAQTRLDAAHAFDRTRRSVVIAAGTPVGLDLNRVFVSLVTRQFGSGSFRVARVQQEPQPELVTA
jgi:hypothetical protein